MNVLKKLQKTGLINIKSQIIKYCTTGTSNYLILENGKVGEKINLKGWVKSLRKQKENIFVDLSDGSTPEKVQIIISQKGAPKNLTTGSSICTTGTIQLSPKNQKEVNAQEITVLGECVVGEGFPFAPRKQYSQEYIRQHLQFRPRTNKFASLLRVRSAANVCFHNYLTSQGFINVHTPILTSNDCEGAGEVFRVIPDNNNLIKSMIKEGQKLDEAFFNSKVFLTVSGQLHLEAVAHGLTKVYTLGPTFRAENSRSRLHLSEFYMLETEIAFLDSIDDLMKYIELLIKNTTKAILDSCHKDIVACQGDNSINFDWLQKNFAVLTYVEAENILKSNQKSFENKFDSNEGICKEHELFLTKHCGNVPVFIIDWPKSMKPFYMRECPDDESKVSALDLLVPNVGEIVGGSLRENNIDKLKKNLPEHADDIEWYFDLRKFGSVPTGGYGLGFDRYLLFLTGISNIKDVIPFPRWPHNCAL